MAHGGGEHHEEPKRSRNLVAWLLVGAFFVLGLILFNLAPKGTKQPQEQRMHASVSQSTPSPASRTTVQVDRVTRTYQKPVGTECEPFNTNGSTCEVGTGGSDWTRIDPNAPSGKYICWSPGGRTLFKEVWYISGSGQEKRYDFDNPPGAEEKPSAYRWVPVEKLHMTYGLQDAPCSYPS